MPEDEEKYFPSTGHSFKLRRPTGKKNRIRLNLVHEWPAFINVFSPNYSPLFLSLTSICRRLFGPRNSPDLRVRQKKKKARIALWLPWICNERLPTAIFSSFSRGEREREEISSMNDYQDVGYRWKVAMFWNRLRCIYDRDILVSDQETGMKMDLQKESFIWKRAGEKGRNDEIAQCF